MQNFTMIHNRCSAHKSLSVDSRIIEQILDSDTSSTTTRPNVEILFSPMRLLTKAFACWETLIITNNNITNDSKNPFSLDKTY